MIYRNTIKLGYVVVENTRKHNRGRLAIGLGLLWPLYYNVDTCHASPFWYFFDLGGTRRRTRTTATYSGMCSTYFNDAT